MTACCYKRSGVVCLSVCLSVCYDCEPCKDGQTDRDSVWVVDSGGPKEPRIRWGTDPSCEGAILRGKGRPIAKYRDSTVIRAKTAEPMEMPFGMWIPVGPI